MCITARIRRRSRPLADWVEHYRVFWPAKLEKLKRVLKDGPVSDSIDSVIVECELPDPPEKVWRALTEPDLVAEWLTADEPAPIEREVVLEEPHRLAATGVARRQ